MRERGGGSVKRGRRSTASPLSQLDDAKSQCCLISSLHFRLAPKEYISSRGNPNMFYKRFARLQTQVLTVACRQESRRQEELCEGRCHVTIRPWPFMRPSSHWSMIRSSDESSYRFLSRELLLYNMCSFCLQTLGGSGGKMVIAEFLIAMVCDIKVKVFQQNSMEP